MSDFVFTEERRRANGMEYDIIAGYTIPPMNFPTQQEANEFIADMRRFEREIFRWGDLDVVVYNGKRMYFCEVTYLLADWIVQSALSHGGTVENHKPVVSLPQPFLSTKQDTPKPALKKQDTKDAFAQVEKAIEENVKILKDTLG